jgi:hypothetical protein
MQRGTGLPDAIFSNPNPNFGEILEGLPMVEVGIFNGHLVYFTFIWYFYCNLVNLGIFSKYSRFCMFCQKQIWHPWCKAPWTVVSVRLKSQTYQTEFFQDSNLFLCFLHWVCVFVENDLALSDYIFVPLFLQKLQPSVMFSARNMALHWPMVWFSLSLFQPCN